MLGTCALVFATVAAMGLARADGNDDRRALVMLRVLAYDKQLDVRAGEVVRIVIVHPKSEAGSAEAARWMRAFASARKLKVDGRPVEVSTHAFDGAAGLARALDNLHPAALLACDGLAAKLAISELAKLSRARRVLSFTTRESEASDGLAVGIVPGKDRDEIVVNLRAAAAEGVKFDAGLLQLSRSVGAP